MLFICSIEILTIVQLIQELSRVLEKPDLKKEVQGTWVSWAKKIVELSKLSNKKKCKTLLDEVDVDDEGTFYIYIYKDN